MAGKTAGSLRNVTLDGVSYDVAVDVDMSEIASPYENADVPTSGATLRKMIKRTEARENVTLIVSDEEFEVLRELSIRQDDIPMSYELASGAVFRTEGWIDIEMRNTAENRASIRMVPRIKWNLFTG